MIVVEGIRGENSRSLTFVENDEVIHAFATGRSGEALRVGILPRRSPGNWDLAETQSRDASPELGSIDPIRVADQVLVSVLGQGLDHLLRSPGDCRVRGDVDVEKPALLQAQHDEHVEQPEGDCRQSMAMATLR